MKFSCRHINPLGADRFGHCRRRAYAPRKRDCREPLSLRLWCLVPVRSLTRLLFITFLSMSMDPMNGRKVEKILTTPCQRQVA